MLNIGHESTHTLVEKRTEEEEEEKDEKKKEKKKKKRKRRWVVEGETKQGIVAGREKNRRRKR